MRAFFRLAGLWGLTMEEARVLLGRPSRARLYNWKAGRVRGLPHDTLQRISYLLGIHKALQILYSEPASGGRLGAACRMPPSAARARSSACSRAMSADLAAVRAHLDAARGGWT